MVLSAPVGAKVKPLFNSSAVFPLLATVTEFVAVTELVAVRVPVLTDVSPVKLLASWIFRPLLPSCTTPMLFSVKLPAVA